jgi:hypothetical protein
MVVEGSAFGHSDLILITRYYPINSAITYKEHGDEAYIWRSGIIRFRKGNFVIEVVATKPAIAEKLSAYAAEAVPEK